MTNREILKTPKDVLVEVDRQRLFLLRVESMPVFRDVCRRGVRPPAWAGSRTCLLQSPGPAAGRVAELETHRLERKTSETRSHHPGLWRS